MSKDRKSLAQKTACILLVVFSSAVVITILTRGLRLSGTQQLSDLQHYSFAFLVLLSILVTFTTGEHVTVKWIRWPVTSKGRLLLNRVWLVLFAAFPMSLVGILALPDAQTSTMSLEGSREHGGLPGYFLVKIALCFVLLLIAVEAIRQVFRSLHQEK